MAGPRRSCRRRAILAAPAPPFPSTRESPHRVPSVPLLRVQGDGSIGARRHRGCDVVPPDPRQRPAAGPARHRDPRRGPDRTGAEVRAARPLSRREARDEGRVRRDHRLRGDGRGADRPQGRPRVVRRLHVRAGERAQQGHDHAARAARRGPALPLGVRDGREVRHPFARRPARQDLLVRRGVVDVGPLDAASALLQAGIDPDKAFRRVAFSGAHDATALSVAGGKVDAGALNISVWEKLVADGKVDPSTLRVFYTTPPYHDYNWSVRSDMDPALMGKLRAAFLALSPDTAEGREVLGLQRASRFVPTSAGTTARSRPRRATPTCCSRRRARRRAARESGARTGGRVVRRARRRGARRAARARRDRPARRRRRALVLIGPSGAGKTTLLMVCALQRRPVSGRVTIDGIDPWTLSTRARHALRRTLAIAPQTPPLPPRQRVVTSVLAGRLPRLGLVASLASLVYPRRADLAHDALAALGLADKLWLRVDRLSGGERQRVSLARVLVSDATRWLVDEPLSALDPALAERSLPVLIDAARATRRDADREPASGRPRAALLSARGRPRAAGGSRSTAPPPTSTPRHSATLYGMRDVDAVVDAHRRVRRGGRRRGPAAPVAGRRVLSGPSSRRRVGGRRRRRRRTVAHRDPAWRGRIALAIVAIAVVAAAAARRGVPAMDAVRARQPESPPAVSSPTSSRSARRPRSSRRWRSRPGRRSRSRRRASRSRSCSRSRRPAR